MSHDRNSKMRWKLPTGLRFWRATLLPILLMMGAGIGSPGIAHGKGGDRLAGFPSIDLRSGEQYAKSMAVDSEGNVIIVGSVGSVSTDYFVAKFKADGSGLSWTPVSYGGAGTDVPTAVAIDSSNNIVVTGYSWHSSNYDVQTIKFSGATGEVIWQHSFDNDAVHGDDYGTAIAIDGSDNIYVAGYSANGTKSDDFLLLKYPSAGATPTWVALSEDSAYPNNINRFTAIAAGTGGIAVTGYSSKGGSDFDILTRKYDSNGNVIREWRYGSPANRDDRGNAVKMDAAGNVVVTGFFTNASNNKDIYTAKYNPGSSTPLWERIYNNDGGNGEDEPQGLWIDAAGDVYIAGSTGTLAGNTDIYTARYNGVTGEVVWQTVFDGGGGSADVPVGIIVDDAVDGGVFVTGYTTVGSTEDFLTLKYRKDNGGLLWKATWNNSFNLNDRPVGIALSGRNVVVGGWTDGGASGDDFIVLKYDFGEINAPTKLTATATSDSSIRLTWTDNSINEEKFIVQRKLGETGTWSGLDAPPPGFVVSSPTPPNSAGTVTWNDPDTLESNKYYYYRVAACIGAGATNCSYPSDPAHALTKVVTYDPLTWSYVYDGADHRDDVPTDITFASDNNPVVTGYSELTEVGVAGMYTYDYMTIKIDRNDKSVKWKARYDSGDGGTDMAAGLAFDSTGNLLVTGTAYLSGGTDKSDELYTRKVQTSTVTDPAAEPNFLWDDQFGTQSGIDYATAISMVRDGSNNSVVLGYGQNSKVPQDHDIFVIKLNNNGTRAWAPVVYDSGRNDEPAGLAIDSAGDIFVTGYSYDKGDTAEGSYDWFTAKYSGATGNLIWSDTYNISHDVYGRVTGNDQASAIDVDSAGNAYVTGYATNAEGQSVLYTVKYDGAAVPAGKRRVWEKAFNRTINGIGYDAEGVSVKVDPIDGAVVVAGTAFVNATDSDIHLIRYNPTDGRLTAGGVAPYWEINFDRPGSYEYAVDMTLDASGYIYVTGNTRSGPETDPAFDGTSNIISLIYDYEGTFLGALTYDGTGRKDEAKAITANYVGEAFVAGLATNGANNADYAVVKHTNNYLLVPAPFTATAQADSSKVNLGWQHNNPSATFIIERTPGPATPLSVWDVIATPAAGSTSFIDTSLTADTSYCYRINALYNTLPSRKVVTCVTTRLPAPVLQPPVVDPDPLNPKITITWNNVPNNTGYKIERRVGAGTWIDLITKGANVTTYMDSGLATGTTYTYRVTTLGTAGNSLPSNELGVITKPATPTLTAPTGITNCQMTLSWSPGVTGAASYTLEAKPSGGSYSPVSGCTGIAATTCTATGLNDKTTYYIHVKASNASGDSAWSAEQSGTTSLPAPSLNAPTNVTNSTADLSWTTVTIATSYTLYYKDGTGGTYAPVPGCTAIGGTSCTASALTPAHTYYFQVKSNTACGNSDPSNERSALVALVPPTATTPTGATDTSLTLSWNSITGATWYTVETKISGGTYAPVPTCTGISATTCTVSGLTPNRTYYFHVKAGNAVVNGDSNWSNEVTGKTKLSTPTLSGATGGAAQVALTWTSVPEATVYKVEQGSCTSSDSDPTLCRGADANYGSWTTLTQTVTGTSYTASSLLAGSNYRYRITALVTGNTSAASNVLYAWTNMTAPTLTVGAGVDDTSLNLSWTTQSGETNYEIKRADVCTGPWTVVVPAHSKNTTTYLDTPLAKTTQYCYIVTAYSTEAFPPPNAPSACVCKTTPLPAPTLNMISVASTTELDLTWNHLNSNTGYEIERCPSSDNQTPTGRTVGSPCTNLPRVSTDVEYLNNTGLAAGNTYRYRVRAWYNNSTENTAWSTEQWATTIPLAPVMNTPSSPTTSSLYLTWGDVVGDNGYKVYWKARTGTDCSAGTWNGPLSVALNNAAFTHSGLNPGTFYCYYITAAGSPGPPVTPDSAPSNIVSQTTVPSAPTQNDPSNISGSSVTVNWTDVTGETGYAVYRRTASGSYAQVGTVGANTTYFVDTGLSTGTLYFYTIYATSTVGNSAGSLEKSATTTPAVPVPTATAISDDRVDVCWPLVYGATYYRIDRKVGAGGTFGQLANPSIAYSTSYCGESSPTVGCPSPSAAIYCYQDTGLTENTTYYYHLHAGNGTESAESIEKSATTLSISTQNMTATALNGGQMVRLDWTPMTCSPVPCDNPDYYEIQRQVREGYWTPLKIVTGTTSTYTDNIAIDPNYRYRYRIRSLKGDLQSQFSEAEVFAKPYVSGTNVCK